VTARCAALLGLALASSPALAQTPSPLEVIAPDGCVDGAILHADLARAGVDVGPAAPWRARVVVRRVAPSRWRLTVDVAAERDTHDAREAERCEGLPELAALLVRNALPPPPAPVPPRGATPAALRVGVSARVGGVVAVGMVAPFSPGIAAAAGVVVRRVRAELGVGWYAPQGDVGSLTAPRVEALYGALRGCYAPTGDDRALRLDLCLDAELGAIGNVFGPDDPSLPVAQRSLWMAVRPGAMLTWRPTPAVGLWAEAGVRAMLVNPPPALAADAPERTCVALRCLDPVSSWAQPVFGAGLEVRIR